MYENSQSLVSIGAQYGSTASNRCLDGALHVFEAEGGKLGPEGREEKSIVDLEAAASTG